MNQEQLDTLVELWCLTAQESLGDYELVVESLLTKPTHYRINLQHEVIDKRMLPFEFILGHYTPKEKAKIVISLLEQIVNNGDQWLRDEENYYGDKLAEKGDDDYKSNKEND